MVEENKEEGKKEEENNKKEDPVEIVLKVDMHCEACARKVAKALKGFEGVEEVSADCRASRVVVKGKGADPIKVRERLHKKSRKKVELISPLPKPPQQEQEQQQEQNNKEEKKEPPPPPEKEEIKDEPPPVVTVVLKVGMHCEACAQVIQKRIRKIQGVESVETELVKDQVTVKGVIEPTKLVDYVYKRTGKQASIVKDEGKKEEEEKKKQEDKKENNERKEGEETNKEKEEEQEDYNNAEIKRSDYWPSKNYVDYAYTPHFFSDENPNACSVM